MVKPWAMRRGMGGVVADQSCFTGYMIHCNCSFKVGTIENVAVQEKAE